MRRLLLIVLIAMLPLRVWAGGAMATQMAVAGVAESAQAVAVDAAAAAAAPVSAPAQPSGVAVHQADGTMPIDCAGHAAQAAPAATNADFNTDCPTCASCQICQGVAFATQLVGLPLTDAPQVVPQLQSSHFASAEPARGFKPPIS